MPYEKGLVFIEIRNSPEKIIPAGFKICECGNDYLAVFGISDDIHFRIKEDSGLNNYLRKELLYRLDCYSGKKKFVRIKHRTLLTPAVMGILNVTPDSFSDGGKYFSTDSAVKRAAEMIEDGAEIIDIGGESTRPGSLPVPEDEEISRIIPVIKEIKALFPGILISADTKKSKTADEALIAGADIINDVSAGDADEKMYDVINQHKAVYIIMHMQGTPATMQINPTYTETVNDIYDYLYLKAEKLKSAGIENLITDPGIGFGKTVKDNYQILGRIKEFSSIGFPVLAGLSRKSFLGNSLNIPVYERDTASIIAESLTINSGAEIIRTHNVKNAVQAKKIFNFINNPELLT